MAAKKEAAKKEAPKVEDKPAAKAGSPVISTETVKENVYRLDMGESIP